MEPNIPRDHSECSHTWASWFGPVLKCSKCGAETITSAAPGESKPIFKPVQPTMGMTAACHQAHTSAPSAQRQIAPSATLREICST